MMKQQRQQRQQSIHCCGMELKFFPRKKFCSSKCKGFIGPYQKYYLHRRGGYIVCSKCYGQRKSSVEIINDAGIFNLQVVKLISLTIRKSEFEIEINNREENEKMIKCSKCERNFHQACVMYDDAVVDNLYICKNCVAPDSQLTDRYTANNLEPSRLSLYVENRVSRYIDKLPQSSAIGRVLIRVVTCTKKTVKLGPQIEEFLTDTEMDVKGVSHCSEFPYKSKMIMAFQESEDASEVAFFSIIVHEFGSECPEPNCRRVYLAYIDSVQHFHPKEHRTAIYHEIVLGYLEYCREQGFEFAHFWSCPATVGTDYIFYAHPNEQKFPTAARLASWYKNMMKKGKEDGTLIDYKELLDYCIESKFKDVTQVPYFECDFWASTLEEVIAEDKNIKSKSPVSQQQFPLTSSQLTPPPTPRPPRSYKKRRIWNYPIAVDEVMEKAMRKVHQLPGSLWVARLIPHARAVTIDVIDHDLLLSSEFMDSREGFVEYCRESNLEFSSLRLAKFSNMKFVHQQHFHITDIITCNGCDIVLGGSAYKLPSARYICHLCPEYDLCVNCYTSTLHIHPMTKKIEKEVKDEVVKPWAMATAFSLVMSHAFICTIANCFFSGCGIMKTYLGLKQAEEDDEDITQHRHEDEIAQRSCKDCNFLKAMIIAHDKYCPGIDTCHLPLCLRYRQISRRHRE